jgi:hypothetical protein
VDAGERQPAFKEDLVLADKDGDEREGERKERERMRSKRGVWGVRPGKTTYSTVQVQLNLEEVLDRLRARDVIKYVAIKVLFLEL